MRVLRNVILKLAVALAGLTLPSSTVMAGKVYWVQSFEDRIGRANLDGSGPQVLPTFVLDPIAIAVDPAGGKFYFIQSFDDKVLRADLDGTNVTPVLAPPQVFDPAAIAVDSVGGKIYCAQSFDDKIIRANLDGSAPEPIVEPPISLNPAAVAVDPIAGKIYWAENPGNRIQRANLNGTNAETVVDSIFVADPVSIAVDGGNGKLYWAERSGDRIRRADTGGLNLNVVTFLDAVFVSDPVSISLDLVNARIFWAEGAEGRIRRADLAGAGVITILEAPHLFDPLAVSVDPTPPPIIEWNADALSTERTTRSLRFKVNPPATAAGAGMAIKVTMIDLQHPIPPNLPANPPPDFSGYESGACAPMVCDAGTRNGAVCVSAGDCPGGKCTTAGETNGCARWVGKAGTFMEAQGPPASGPFRAARLQCTPVYVDWMTKTPGGPLAVVGAEIVPSSEYSVQAYGASCKGVEGSCTDVFPPVTMYTRRSGDVASEFNPPATTEQPNSLDVTALVNKFKGATTASLVKAVTQLQPNLPELNADVGALDIVAAVDAVKELAYAISGPCPCPSQATCNALACATPGTCTASALAGLGTGAMCVKTCTGGDNAGEPCINDTHCAGGTCGAGFCRDRCGRCN